MKNIVFKKLAIKNFLSVGDVPVVIDFKTGLNIITGANKDKESGLKTNLGRHFFSFGKFSYETRASRIYLNDRCPI